MTVKLVCRRKSKTQSMDAWSHILYFWIEIKHIALIKLPGGEGVLGVIFPSQGLESGVWRSFYDSIKLSTPTNKIVLE